MSVMLRQVFALFEEYQSKENAKHTLLAMRKNARQGFWNGSKAPYGYAVVAAEQRGAKTKKRVAIDPVEIGARTYGSVKSILDNKLDRRPAPKRPADTAPILHPNIRGPRYYH